MLSLGYMGYQVSIGAKRNPGIVIQEILLFDNYLQLQVNLASKVCKCASEKIAELDAADSKLVL